MSVELCHSEKNCSRVQLGICTFIRNRTKKTEAQPKFPKYSNHFYIFETEKSKPRRNHP